VTVTPPSSNGGSPITAYDVQFVANSGSTYSTTSCSITPATPSCTVKSSEFTSYPFYLTPGSDIKAKVRAQNAVGYGDYSDLSVSEAKIYTAPTGYLRVSAERAACNMVNNYQDW